MPTGSTDRSPGRPAPSLYARAVMLGVVGAFALCLGSVLLIRTRPADVPAAPKAPGKPAMARVAEMDPVVPWSPAAKVNAVPQREGPYTLDPDAEMIESGSAFITLLGDDLRSDRFIVSDHGNEGGFQGGDWVPENVVATSDGVRLDVTPTGNPKKPYALSEVQLAGLYGYGRYEVVMRPAKGSGLVSAFFVYTGPWFGDPHDEIDIEFVGKEMTEVQLNYFHKGKKGHFANIKLPFDASEEDHLYAFDWKPEGISWYVDGELIYETPKGDPRIPNTSGRIYFSNWTGIPALRQWHGNPDFGDRGSAYYSCISFTPLGENSRRCSDVYRPGTRFPEPVK